MSINTSHEGAFDVKPELRIVNFPNPAVRGTYWFFSTYGLPLGEIWAKMLSDYDLYPDWSNVCLELAGNGWDNKRIFNYIAEEMSGVYPPDVAITIRQGIQKMLHLECSEA